ncbi:MAG: hypothetical protein Q7R35_14505 [Elusimicrobiota bacterium]|nr:hypothetical protein [Elusimicrobiota bacterium]
MNIHPFYTVSIFDEARQMLRQFGASFQRLVHLWALPSALEKKSTQKTFHHFRPAFINLGDADFNEPNPREGCRPLSRVFAGSVREIVSALRAKEPGAYTAWSDRMAHRALALTVPKPIRDIIVSRFEDRHYHAVSLIARCPGAGELAETAPGLFYCAASAHVLTKNTWPMRAIREILRGSPKGLLKFLGFPKSSFKIFQRTSSHMRIINYLYLRTVMQNEELLRKLYFQPKISPLFVRVFSDPVLEPHTNYNFWLECGGIEEEGEGIRERINTLRDTLDMLTATGRADNIVFESWQNLERVHREALAELKRRPAIRYLPPLPPPPFLGIREPEVIDIEPLTSSEDVIEWNEALGGLCIEFNYLPPVARGKGFLYKIQYPEEACLYVDCINGKYRNRQLRGINNSRVLPETEAAVKWFLELRNSQEGGV